MRSASERIVDVDDGNGNGNGDDGNGELPTSALTPPMLARWLLPARAASNGCSDGCGC